MFERYANQVRLILSVLPDIAITEISPICNFGIDSR